MCVLLTDCQENGKSKSHEFHGGGLESKNTQDVKEEWWKHTKEYGNVSTKAVLNILPKSRFIGLKIKNALQNTHPQTDLN